MLNDLHIPFTDTLLSNLKVLLDPFGNHYIDTRAFCLHMQSYAQKCSDLLKDLTTSKKMVVESTSGGKCDFSAPLKGIVKINIVEVIVRDPVEASAGRTIGMLPRKCRRLIDSAHKTANSQAMLTCALVGSHFYVEEARELFAHLFALLDDPVAAVAMLGAEMCCRFSPVLGNMTKLCILLSDIGSWWWRCCLQRSLPYLWLTCFCVHPRA